MNIINHIHKFKIDEEEIELTVNCKNGYWTCAITKGETICGNCSGGSYESLEDYIKENEKEHRYTYNFFNKGYEFAKSNI